MELNSFCSATAYTALVGAIGAGTVALFSRPARPDRRTLAAARAAHSRISAPRPPAAPTPPIDQTSLARARAAEQDYARRLPTKLSRLFSRTISRIPPTVIRCAKAALVGAVGGASLAMAAQAGLACNRNELPPRAFEQVVVKGALLTGCVYTLCKWASSPTQLSLRHYAFVIIAGSTNAFTQGHSIRKK